MKKIWRFFRWVLFCVFALTVLTVLFYAEEDWRGRRALKNYERQWEARGERFDFKDFIPKPVPDDQNFALTPIVATCYEWMLDKSGHELKPHRTNVVERLWMHVRHYPPGDAVSRIEPTNGDWRIGKMCDLKSWQMYYRTPFTNMFLLVEDTPAGEASYWKPFSNSGSILTNDFVFPPTPQSPAADVLLALGKYDSDIEELRAASRLTNSRFPLNYDAKPPQPVYLMHWGPLKYCCETLQLRAIAELESGECQKALDDVMLSLRLVDSVRTEPFYSSHYIRSEMVKMVVQVVWEGLAKRKWSDAQISAIEHELGRLDFLADCQWSLRCERNQALATANFWVNQQSYDDVRKLVGGLADSGLHGLETEEDNARLKRKVSALAWFCYLMPKGWYDQNQILIAQTYQEQFLPEISPTKHLFSPEKWEAAGKIVESLPHRRWNFLARWFLTFGAANTGAKKFVYAQETIDLARVACALERYRLAHGEYPDTLDILAPQFISEVPLDIVGGQPLHFRRMNKDGFMLYSVGWDNTDDGGVVALNETLHWAANKWVREPNDWVWKYGN